jgi:hypothetical protein
MDDINYFIARNISHENRTDISVSINRVCSIFYAQGLDKFTLVVSDESSLLILGSLQQRSVPDLLPTTGASQLWERSM